MPTSLSDLKLQLIQAIIRTEDPEVLQAALKVLSLGGSPGQANLPVELNGLSALLNQERKSSDPDLEDLQRDIDDVFNL
ncbi:MAG: hypothetical protein KI786_04200 [Mameliella sp.]|nr:hypothetical protein [Phaeodactylibacter sp.]